jgi:hypothetical protein
MKNLIQITSVTLLTGLLAGCYTTGMSPREQGGNRYSELVYGFCERQEPDATDPETLHLPIRLGVAQIGETAPANELVDSLNRHPALVANVIKLPLAGNTENNRYYYQQPKPDSADEIRQQADTLRKLGQQMGADYILVVGGNIDSHVESSPIQILDMAIVPGVIIPSQKIEMSARVGGAFINAKNGRVEFLLTTTSETTNSCPTFYVDQKIEEMAMKQRSTLSKQLVEELASKIIWVR